MSGILFEPIRIGEMELRNRLVMAPMENLYAGEDSLPGSRMIRYLEARARGGIGLITLGATSVHAQHKEVPNALHFADDGVIDAHRVLTDAVHAHGAKIQPQLSHAGPDGLGPEMHQVEAIGPSRIQSYLTQTTSRELDTLEFEDVIDLFKAAALRIRRAGYDGIELHAAHGYMLLGAFLTPWRNARRDQYSARRREGRTKVLVDVVRAIKKEAGEDFPITLRISGYERIAGGRDSTDTQRMAPDLVAAGVDAFHVSGGVIDRYVTQMVNGSHYPDALNEAAAAAVKRVVNVPVIAVGRIHDPETAERLVAEGKADLIAMGRPMLADPELPNKIRSGRYDDVRRCISCQNCIDAMEIRFAMDCSVNPRTGREQELAVVRATAPKHIVIIGAGPGGLEAARVAAERGHRVSLFDRNRYLGGALVMAATVHAENQPFLDYLRREVTRSRAALHLGAQVDVNDVMALSPDAVIVATGGRVATRAIAGDNLPHVLTGSQLRGFLAGDRTTAGIENLPGWQRLGLRLLGGRAQSWVRPELLRTASKIWMPLGRRVVIIGADLAAIELAEFLAERARQVSVLETADHIAPEVGGKRRAEHMYRLDHARVPINTGVAIVRIARDGVVLRVADGAESLVPADNVIIAGEVEPDTTLFDDLKGRLNDVHAVGDCTGLGLIQKAVLEGATAACAIG